MTLNIMYFFLTSVSALAQYGALLLNYDTKSKVWRRGIYVGMVGSTYSAGAFMQPYIELYPCLVFIFSMAVMLSCVALWHYNAPLPLNSTEEEKEDRLETKQTTVRQLGIGMVIIVTLSGVTAYVQTQSTDHRVQQGFAGVVYRLADEVKSLHTIVSRLTDEVQEIKHQQKAAAEADSIARKRNFQNQERLLKRLK